MAISKHGRALATITVDGEEVRPKDAVFIIYNPQGEMAAFMQSDARMMDSIAAAARSHWVGETTAMEKLNEGWRVGMMTFANFQKKFLNPSK